MGLSHSPKIVTDGLVLALDAANQKSWYGDGTTWKDMSGKGNNGTLTNGTLHSQGPFPGTGYVTFDGTDDYLTTTYSTSEFRWWDTDYTIEAWIYPTTLTDWYGTGGQSYTIPALVGNMDPNGITNYWSFGPYNSSGNIQFYYYNGTPQHAMVSTESLTVDSWNHIAFIKNNSGCKIFVNGVGTNYMAISGTPQDSTSYNLTIGAYYNHDINGYVSNLRIVRGTALYTSNFTVPKEPLQNISNTKLLTCRGSSITDASDSSHNITVTGNSTAVYNNDACFEFDGTNDYITFSSSSSFGFGTGDFTVELFIRPDVVPSTNMGLCASLNTGTPVGFYFGADSTGEITFSFNSASATTFTANSTDVKWAANVWQHIVLRRGSGDVMIFLDGSQIGTTKTDTANLGTSDDFVIGRYYTNYDDYYFDGKISNFRIYSKALTTSEIQQNFNALRGRYGI